MSVQQRCKVEGGVEGRHPEDMVSVAEGLDEEDMSRDKHHH